MTIIRSLTIYLCLLDLTRAFHIVSRSDHSIHCRASRQGLRNAGTSRDSKEVSSLVSIFGDGDQDVTGGVHVGLSRRSAFTTLATLSSFVGTTCFFHDVASAVQDDNDNDRLAEIHTNPSRNTFLSTSDPKSTTRVSMPLIAYSLYKTSPEQSPRGLALAFRAGVRHFDMATTYGNFDVVAPMFRQYWSSGKIPWRFEEEKDELLQTLDATRAAAEKYDYDSIGGSSGTKLRGKQRRRREVFVTYKLSNGEQSTDPVAVRRTVKNLLSQLDTTYLDLVCLHSPLTGPDRRLATYKTLLELKNEGLIRAVGVCNYGFCHLRELTMHGLPLPSVNQLELSPFNMHDPIVRFCQQNNVQLSCAAWSRLSSTDGPVKQWSKLGEVAKARGVTKAQVLVRWALQKGFACAPRSGTGSKLERIAIAENSYGGVVNFELSTEEMRLLDSLDINYKSGKLGRRDGWNDEDVTGVDWDPTEASCSILEQ
eukprot:CCRYP_007590-RA/>CCRYP_007590-RA protein AED:0.05 eAED:0.05 QI:143/1/1/1/1/1/2/1575/479